MALQFFRRTVVFQRVSEAIQCISSCFSLFQGFFPGVPGSFTGFQVSFKSALGKAFPGGVQRFQMVPVDFMELYRLSGELR